MFQQNVGLGKENLNNKIQCFYSNILSVLRNPICSLIHPIGSMELVIFTYMKTIKINDTSTPAGPVGRFTAISRELVRSTKIYPNTFGSQQPMEKWRNFTPPKIWVINVITLKNAGFGVPMAKLHASFYLLKRKNPPKIFLLQASVSNACDHLWEFSGNQIQVEQLVHIPQWHMFV